jgi:hypothetical protein
MSHIVARKLKGYLSSTIPKPACPTKKRGKDDEEVEPSEAEITK